jgi:hypothetical protein
MINATGGGPETAKECEISMGKKKLVPIIAVTT